VSVVYSARGISKRFGVVQALSGVDLDVAQGKVVGLVGANGAGKSTLLKIIAGALTPDSGELRLDGEPLCDDVHHACSAGGNSNRFTGAKPIPGSQCRGKPFAGTRRA
jgi:ABC-type sugar transport system ATPase subunit